VESDRVDAPPRSYTCDTPTQRGWIAGRRDSRAVLRRCTTYALLHLPIAGCGDATTTGDCSPSPVRGSWSDLPSLIAARTRHSATSLASGDIVVAGGQTCADEPAELAAVERYSADADRWVELAALPAPRRGHVAIALREDQEFARAVIDENFDTSL
jgi:hypothetical protein